MCAPLAPRRTTCVSPSPSRWSTWPAHPASPLTSSLMSCRLYLSSVVPIAALYSLSLCSYFSASIYLPVSFMSMIKAFTPVAVYSIYILFKLETTRASSMAPYIIMIVVNVIIVVCGETELNARGLTLQLRSYPRPPVPSSFKSSSHPKGHHFIPLEARLYYFALCCLAFLLLPWFLFELPIL